MKTSPSCIALVFGLVFVGHGIARAQGADQPKSVPGHQSLAAPANLTFGAAPPGSGGAGFAQVILEASTKEKVGTASFGWQTGQGTYRLAFSGPVGDSGDATPISLTGLNAGATAKFSANRLSWRGPTHVERREIERVCAKHGLRFDATELTKLCQLSNIPDAADRAEYSDLQHLNDVPWIFGAEITAGQVTQKYLLPGTLAPDSTKKVTWSLSGRAGAFLSNVGFLIGSYTYGESLKAAGPAAQICRPIADAAVEGALTCANHVIGEPVSKAASVVAIELRRLVSKRLAWSPNVQIDLKRDKNGKRVAAVDVPIYFLNTAGTTAPTGGVRFAWRSDEKELTAVIFIGAAFRMLQ